MGPDETVIARRPHTTIEWSLAVSMEVITADSAIRPRPVALPYRWSRSPGDLARWGACRSLGLLPVGVAVATDRPGGGPRGPPSFGAHDPDWDPASHEDVADYAVHDNGPLDPRSPVWRLVVSIKGDIGGGELDHERVDRSYARSTLNGPSKWRIVCISTAMGFMVNARSMSRMITGSVDHRDMDRALMLPRPAG